MYRLPTILTFCFFVLTNVSGQKAMKFDTLKYVYKIDKYCNSIAANKKYITVFSCGDKISISTTSKLKKDFLQKEVLCHSKTIYDSLSNRMIRNNFFYKNHKLVRAIMTFTNSSTQENYEAKYYFDNDNLVYVIGETSRYFTAVEIIASSINDNFCIP